MKFHSAFFLQWWRAKVRIARELGDRLQCRNVFFLKFSVIVEIYLD